MKKNVYCSDCKYCNNNVKKKWNRLDSDSIRCKYVIRTNNPEHDELTCRGYLASAYNILKLRFAYPAIDNKDHDCPYYARSIWSRLFGEGSVKLV